MRTIKKTLLVTILACGVALSTTGPALAQDSADDGNDIIDPCPKPDVALRNTPDTLSEIQADIDRYTLCVERATLLERLNSLTMEAQGIPLPGQQGTEDQANADPFSPPDFNAADFRNIMQPRLEPLPGTDVGADLPPPPSFDPQNDDWGIVRIFGTRGQLTAKLAKPDGTLAHAKAGTKLSDGSIVSNITPTGVMLKKDGEDHDLVWLQ